MTTVASFEFVAGKYHATPWGRHVNEGAIEWPPSPWRLMRALISTGFNRLGWTDGIPAEARQLLSKLAEQPPRYYLPPANASHSRHYLPLFDGKTTKVLDTFAVLSDPLLVEWPAVLNATERSLLGSLLEAMPYLGRAESWVQAKLTDVAPVPRHVRWCSPSKQPPSVGYERTDLLSPLPSAGYAAWRAEHVANSARVRLEQEAAKALERNKKPPSQLNAKQLEAIESRYPVDLCEMLRVDTSTLQSEGWSVPPGTRWLTYWRPLDSLESLTREQRRQTGDAADTVLFAVSSRSVSGRTLQPLRRALQVAERLHRTLARSADGASALTIRQLVGRDEKNQKSLGHAHAYVLPFAAHASEQTLERHDAAAIDHIIIHIRNGMSEESRAIVESDLRSIYAREATLRLVPVWTGSATSLDRLTLARESRIWVSHTPYVCPRYLKQAGRHSLFGQIEEELQSLGIKGLEEVEFETRDGWARSEGVMTGLAMSRVATRWRGFLKARNHGPQPPRRQPALGLRLTFSAPVRGPIAIGYASHFGLGLFEPG